MKNNYAILLVRVSSYSQDYQAQIDDLKSFAKKKGYTKFHIIGTKETGLADFDKKVGANELFTFIEANSNYNVVYPIATQPEAARPSTAWTVNYNTNYNVAYPIANQPEAARPVTAYTPGNAGTPTTVLGVYLPGGPVDLSGFAGNPGTAPTVSPTVVSYYDYPDNSNYPVTVPPGGQVNVTLE